MNSLYHYSDSDFYIYYVYDFTLMILFYMRKPILALVGVFLVFGFFSLFCLCLLLWEKQTVLVLYISVVHGVAAFLTPVQCVPLVL